MINPKLKTLLRYIGMTVFIFLIIIILTIVIAGIPTFEIDLITEFIAVLVGFVVLFIVLWLKFRKSGDLPDTNMDNDTLEIENQKSKPKYFE